MAPRIVVLLLLVTGLGGLAGLGGLTGCGHEIGDSCTFSTDCSPNGDRLCDSASPQGYCTVFGCDYSTCPDEAVCVQFFTGNFANIPCDYDPAQAADPGHPRVCSLDELCALDGHCVPRSSEIRYCMRTCGSSADCRENYECRDLEDMKSHGGQPVLASGAIVDQSAPRFCAPKPAS